MRTAVVYVTFEPGEAAVIFRNLSPGRPDRQPIISVSNGWLVEIAQKKIQEALDQFQVPEVIESPTSKPQPPRNWSVPCRTTSTSKSAEVVPPKSSVQRKDHPAPRQSSIAVTTGDSE